ncbi:MAG: DUF167 domain-containing protein [Dehalobacterium sp.]
MINIVDKGGKVSFKVKVQPRASKNGLSGIIGDAVKLRITAPPVDGEANKGVIQYFARLFGVSQKEVVIISGLSSKTKIVEISGVAASEVAEIFNNLSS